MIIGIAYHSPIDIMALLPINTEVSVDPKDRADIFFSDSIVEKYNAKIQFVFASSRVLTKSNLPIIDQGPWGKIKCLTNAHFEKLLEKGKGTEYGKSNTPEWVWR